MPRPKKPDGREPKSRSRNGCWSCKARKVKCTEERPNCVKCVKGGFQCDYGIRLNWDGRRSKRPQLKAVHLNADTDAGGPDGELDGDDGGVGDGAYASDHAAPAGLPATALPPNQLGRPAKSSRSSLSSQAISATSTSAASAPAEGAFYQQLSFLPGQPASTSAKSPPSHPTRPTATTAPGSNSSRAGQAAPATSPTIYRFEVQSSGTWGRRKQGVTAAAAAAAALPATSLVKHPTSPVDTSDSPHPLAKKARRSSGGSGDRDFSWTWPMSPSAGSTSASGTSPQQHLFSAVATQPSAKSPRGPPAEGTSPYPSEDGHARASPNPSGNHIQIQAIYEFRRLSVSSLLSGPNDSSSAAPTPPPTASLPLPIPPLSNEAAKRTSYAEHSHYEMNVRHPSSQHYGVDGGFWDLDLGKNDDANALSGARIDLALGHPRMSDVYNTRQSRGIEGYYSKPVQVRIPRALGPLPVKLTSNPMNMLYFHHFINNTARVLVPHDDPQSNPFRTILPQMAMKNDNLLSLLLAYSASHRAGVLGQKEPAMRIALWVQDIFPALRRALSDPKQKISNANVATAIMLSSLAIVCPTAFGYNIPWQKHLMLARDLISTRPEGLRVDHHSSVEGQVCSFMWSWFAYLDVLGGLSGGPADASPAWILDHKVYDPQDDDEIDCIMGFTTRCIYVLSKVAELVREVEEVRLRCTSHGSGGKISTWVPGAVIEDRVASLEVDVRDSMARTPRPCAHLHRSGDVVRWDRIEMEATNEAYHWSALVHLHRRVLGKPASDPQIRENVQHIIDCCDRVTVGGTAENCLLFPIFTAGCECLDEDQRRRILERMLIIETSGMMQVSGARALMQNAWATGKDWETLLTNEFIG